MPTVKSKSESSSITPQTPVAPLATAAAQDVELQLKQAALEAELAAVTQARQQIAESVSAEAEAERQRRLAEAVEKVSPPLAQLQADITTLQQSLRAAIGDVIDSDLTIKRCVEDYRRAYGQAFEQLLAAGATRQEIEEMFPQLLPQNPTAAMVITGEAPYGMYGNGIEAINTKHSWHWNDYRPYDHVVVIMTKA